jgi:hypothetical protein
MQVRDPDDPDDIAENNYDHVCDEARYFLASHLSMKSKMQDTENKKKPVAQRRVFAGSERSNSWMSG